MKNNENILRIKHGYNPNSSSVGSDIPMFLTLTAASGAAALIALNIRNVLRDKWRDDKKLTPHGKDAIETHTNDSPDADGGRDDRVSPEHNA